MRGACSGPAGPGFDLLSSLCRAVVRFCTAISPFFVLRSLYCDQSSGLGLLQGSNLSFRTYW